MGAASSRAGARSYAALEKAAGSAAAKPGLEAAPSRVALDAARGGWGAVQEGNQLLPQGLTIPLVLLQLRSSVINGRVRP